MILTLNIWKEKEQKKTSLIIWLIKLVKFSEFKVYSSMNKEIYSKQIKTSTYDSRLKQLWSEVFSCIQTYTNVVRQIEDTNCDLFIERVSSWRLVLNVTLPRGDKTFLLVFVYIGKQKCIFIKWIEISHINEKVHKLTIYIIHVLHKKYATEFVIALVLRRNLSNPRMSRNIR